MQKFPSLRRLHVMLGEFVSRPGVATCPLNVLLEFFHYLIAIPKFSVELEIRGQYLTSIWSHLIDADHRFTNVAIDFFSTYRNRDVNNLKLTTEFSSIHFTLNTKGDIELLPQIAFFFKCRK